MRRRRVPLLGLMMVGEVRVCVVDAGVGGWRWGFGQGERERQ